MTAIPPMNPLNATHVNAKPAKRRTAGRSSPPSPRPADGLSPATVRGTKNGQPTTTRANTKNSTGGTNTTHKLRWRDASGTRNGADVAPNMLAGNWDWHFTHGRNALRRWAATPKRTPSEMGSDDE